MTETSPALQNSLRIPKADFIEDVDNYMEKNSSKTAVVIINQLEEQRAKYKFMQMNLLEKQRRLKIQIPDIKASIDAIKLLEKSNETGKNIEMKYLLKDQVYVPASIPAKTNTVILCLGANVMAEYTLEEAKKLLSKNLEFGDKNLDQINNDIDFVNDQIVTTEVNMARVHNWEIVRIQNTKKN